MCVRECVFKLSRKLRLCVQAGSYITTGRQRERERRFPVELAESRPLRVCLQLIILLWGFAYFSNWLVYSFTWDI